MKGVNPFHTARATCPSSNMRWKIYCNGCQHLRIEIVRTPKGNRYTDRTCALGGTVKIRSGGIDDG